MNEFKGTKTKWNVCKSGDVSSEHHPICEVTRGAWGDTYPTLGLRGTSLQRECIPVMGMIEYGTVPLEEAQANAQLIASAPELLKALQSTLSLINSIFKSN